MNPDFQGHMPAACPRESYLNAQDTVNANGGMQDGQKPKQRYRNSPETGLREFVVACTK
jgi:hypothetical protein